MARFSKSKPTEQKEELKIEDSLSVQPQPTEELSAPVVNELVKEEAKPQVEPPKPVQPTPVTQQAKSSNSTTFQKFLASQGYSLATYEKASRETKIALMNRFQLT